MIDRKHPEPDGNPSERDSAHVEQDAHIEAIVVETARRLDAGIHVKDAVVEREHPDLMPKLRQRLRDLRLLRAAMERAKQEESAGRPQDPREAMLDEELDTLRAALDNYEVEGRICYGGQGVVYRARQQGTNRIVALKVLLDGPLATERQRYHFEREIELVSRMHHPNIVTVYESGTVRGRLFYAMEFVEGMNIDDWVILHDLTPREIVRLMVKVCRAIGYAHQNGIIHRDLNPSNILVDEQGEPRVFDFGLAKDTWAGEDEARYSFTGQILGTLPYLSPEQAGGLDGKVDVRSDVYALAVVLYELLTDSFPYPIRGEAPAVRNAIVLAEPLPLRKAVGLSYPDRAPGLPTINRDLEMIIAQALAKRKEERYQSASDLADDLQRYLSGAAVEARGHHPLYVLRKTLRKYRWPATLAAVVLVTLTISSIAVTTFWLHARTQRDNARQLAGIAYDLFDTALTDIEESVRTLPGGVAVRDQLIERLAGELPQLQQLVESDQTLEPVLMRLLEKQGDIAFEQGERSAAKQRYEAFLDTGLRLARESPDAYGPVVVRAERKLASVSDEPLPIYEHGIQRGEGILARRPDDVETRYELGQLHAAFANLLRKSSSYKRALQHTEQGLAVCQAGKGENQRERRWSRLAAQLLNRQGLSLQKLGEGARARDALEQSMHLRRQAVAQNPADVEARNQLLRSYMDLGTLAAGAGDVEQGKQFLRTAAEEGRLLARMDPGGTQWDRDRYLVLERLALLCLDTEDTDAAQQACREAVAVAEQRPALGDTSADARDTLGLARLLQGRILIAKEAYTEALQALEQAAEIHEASLASDSENLEQLKRLANLQYWFGLSTRKLHGIQSALLYYQRAHEIYADLHRRQPNAVEAALDLIATQISLAAAHMHFRDAANDEEAAALLSQASEFLDRLHDSGKLHGYERWFAERSEAIRQNQQMLRRRAERRADSGS